MLKPNAKLIFEYVRAHERESITAIDIANALGLSIKTVNGTITAAFTNKELMERVDSGEKNNAGKPIKWIKLTPAGRDFDPDASETPTEE